MQIPNAMAPAIPPPQASPASAKPVSATCCHVFAILCIVSAVILVVVSFSGRVPGAPYAAIGSFAGAVLWWALGDIVATLDRIAARR